LAIGALAAISPAMRNFTGLIAGLALLANSPAWAIVGDAPPLAEGVGRSVVTIVGSRGNFCTGTLIAPDLVLSAAHCVGPGATYKIVDYGADRQPQLRGVKNIADHPGFNMQTMLAHRATADVSLLQLEAPKKNPSPIGAPTTPLAAGHSFTVAGIGVTVRGDGRSGGIVRAAALVATGQPGTLQIRLVDPAGGGTRAGLGACTGDSGGPVFEDQHGKPVVIGIISWSTGPNSSGGCGGLTGVTPLTLYRDWIEKTAKQWGSVLAVP
jgi:Trypsin